MWSAISAVALNAVSVCVASTAIKYVSLLVLGRFVRWGNETGGV